MISKTSYSWLSARAVLNQGIDSACVDSASLYEQDLLPIDDSEDEKLVDYVPLNDETFIDISEDDYISDGDESVTEIDESDEVIKAECDKLDDEIDCQIATFFSTAFGKAVINIAAVVALPTVYSVKLADYIAQNYSGKLKLGLAALESTALLSRPFHAWLDVKAAARIAPKYGQPAQELQVRKTRSTNEQSDETKVTANNATQEAATVTTPFLEQTTTQPAEITEAFVPKESVFRVSDCLWDYCQSNKNQTYTHKIVNECKEEAVVGFIDGGCNVEGNNEKIMFTLTPSSEQTFLTTQNEDCDYPINILSRYDGVRSLKRNLVEYYLKNGNGTVTHKIKNQHTSSNVSGFIKKGCSVTSDELIRFSVPANSRRYFSTKDTKECEEPIFEGEPVKTYQDRYCPSHNSDLPDTPVAAKIIAGHAIPPKERKHLAYVQNDDIGTFCTGTFVSEKHVLTAAHCLKHRASNTRASYLDKIFVRCDPNSKDSEQAMPSHEYPVVAGHINEEYLAGNSDFTNSDIGLLELAHPVSGVTPIPFIADSQLCSLAKELDKVLTSNTHFPVDLNGVHDKSQDVWQHGNAIVQGYGYQKNAEGNLIKPKTLHQGNVVIKHFAENKGNYSLNGAILAEVTQLGSNTCNGDSGGPLIHKTQEGKLVQIGVVSSGDKHCNKDTNFANLIDVKNKNWLTERMQEDLASTTIAARDLTRLRSSPDSCVEKSNCPDGFFGIFNGRRRISFTNNCHHKNHPTSVNIKFYSGDRAVNYEQLETIGEIEEAKQVETIQLGQTKVFYTSGSQSIRPVLSWSDVDAKIGIRKAKSQDLKRK